MIAPRTTSLVRPCIIAPLPEYDPHAGALRVADPDRLVAMPTIIPKGSLNPQLCFPSTPSHAPIPVPLLYAVSTNAEVAISGMLQVTHQGTGITDSYFRHAQHTGDARAPHQWGPCTTAETCPRCVHPNLRYEDLDPVTYRLVSASVDLMQATNLSKIEPAAVLCHGWSQCLPGTWQRHPLWMGLDGDWEWTQMDFLRMRSRILHAYMPNTPTRDPFPPLPWETTYTVVPELLAKSTQPTQPINLRPKAWGGMPPVPPPIAPAQPQHLESGYPIEPPFLPPRDWGTYVDRNDDEPSGEDRA